MYRKVRSSLPLFIALLMAPIGAAFADGFELDPSVELLTGG